MTTCCFDGKMMASDTRCISRFIEPSPFQKVFDVVTKKKKRYIVALAGDYECGLLFIDWIKSDFNKFERPEYQFDEKSGANDMLSSIVYDCQKKVLHYYSANLVPTEVGVPYAIGTGAPYAMGAMYMGATAEQAVEIACRLDENSGLPTKKIKV